MLRTIVDELKVERWYAILADEVTSHLAICARFVDQRNDIREEFLAFIREEFLAFIREEFLAFIRIDRITNVNSFQCKVH